MASGGELHQLGEVLNEIHKCILIAYWVFHAENPILAQIRDTLTELPVRYSERTAGSTRTASKCDASEKLTLTSIANFPQNS